jgi:hypothetical protein
VDLRLLRAAVVLPLVALGVAAALRLLLGSSAGSIARAMAAYAGVALWGWRTAARLPPAQALDRFWHAPPLYVALSLGLTALIAATHEQGVAALTAEWRLLVLRSGAQLALGYLYVGLVRWSVSLVSQGETPDPSQGAP